MVCDWLGSDPSRSKPRKKGPHLQQATPEHSSDAVSKVRESETYSHADLRRWKEEKRSLNQTRLRKRQRTEMLDPAQFHKPGPIVASDREARNKNWEISKVSTKGVSKRKKLLLDISGPACLALTIQEHCQQL